MSIHNTTPDRPDVSTAWKFAAVHRILKQAGVASKGREDVFNFSVNEDELPDISILKQARARVVAIKTGAA